MGLDQTKTFCTEKETINKIQRQPTDWEKISTNDTSDKGLISKMYKELIQPNTKKQTIQLKNGQRTKTDISPKGHADVRQTYEKKYITNHQRNTNQNHNVMSPHTCQNGYHQ